jgi:secondary thiamine-phosphate synthase enzyme
MKTKNKTISLKTKKCYDFNNLTEEVKKFVEDSKIKNGFVNVQSMHTTGVVFVNEEEPLLLSDIEKNMDRLISQEVEYNHDNFKIRTVNMCNDECANGHAHCKAILMPTSVVMNVVDGKIQLGRWQQIFFLELDRPRDRQIQIQIIGE